MSITAPNDICKTLGITIERAENEIRHEVKARAYQVSNQMRNTELQVLSGQRHGRVYKIGGRLHQASAPGEPPAVLTGTLRASFKPNTQIVESRDGMVIHSTISTDVKYAPWLEKGTMSHIQSSDNGMIKISPVAGQRKERIEARPFAGRIFDESVQKAISIYRRPYR